jgi:hypothetical protein
MYTKISGTFICILSFLLIDANAPLPGDQETWKMLFNGRDLTGWDTYLGPAFDSSGNKTGNPIGLNSDPYHVFSIVKDHGENVIRISGEYFGAITTTREYGDFHLRLMFRWGQETWPPKKGKKRDSGLLYHSVGPLGADGGFWMRSQELQIQEGDCGDYWGVAGGSEEVRAIRKSDSEYVYNPAGKLFTFNAFGPTGRRCIKGADGEMPSGQWNTVDLYTHGDTSIHVINGKKVMLLLHSSQRENGKLIPLTSGKIQIQSEGAEVYYKKIMIRSITSIPKNFLD